MAHRVDDDGVARLDEGDRLDRAGEIAPMHRLGAAADVEAALGAADEPCLLRRAGRLLEGAEACRGRQCRLGRGGEGEPTAQEGAHLLVDMAEAEKLVDEVAPVAGLGARMLVVGGHGFLWRWTSRPQESKVTPPSQ